MSNQEEQFYEDLYDIIMNQDQELDLDDMFKELEGKGEKERYDN